MSYYNIKLSHNNFKKNPKKFRKPKPLKDTPGAWLRRLICPFDFGVKYTMLNRQMEVVESHPVHCNTNEEILAAFQDRTRWKDLSRLSNRLLDDHWRNWETVYFVANGSKKYRRILINLDIDCHSKGTPQGAVAAAEYLKANFFPNLYCEPSTNGQGAHAYLILDKGNMGAEAVKMHLKSLEKCLNEHLLARGFDIELFEIKGLPPVVTWGDDGKVTNYRAGVLAKVPRQVERYEEWKQTTVLSEFDITKLVTRLQGKMILEVSHTQPPATVPVQTAAASGSVSGKLMSENELAQLAKDGHYRKVATLLMESHALKTTGRTVVTQEDVAVFLLCLRCLTGRMNADGTLPTRRFEGFWSALYEAGDVDRSFDCHRYKVIRDYLSDLGLLDWQDRAYIVPWYDESGKKQAGRACKWQASQKMMEMLDWEKQEKSREDQVVQNDHEVKESNYVDNTEYEEKLSNFVNNNEYKETQIDIINLNEREEKQNDLVDKGEQEESQKYIINKKKREEASLVGTLNSQSFLNFDSIVQTIQALQRCSPNNRIRPIEQIPGDNNPFWRVSPDECDPLIVSFEELMARLAA